MEQPKARIEYIDFVRALAIILITLMHALTKSFRVGSESQMEFQSIPLLLTVFKGLIYAVSRVGVGFFLMISGALLLPVNYEEEGKTNRFIRNNWLTLFITTEIWLVIMFWYKQILPGSILLNQGIGQCIVKFFMTLLFINPTTMETMWYMPMILCVYLMIPVFAVALKHIPHKYFILPCSLVVFCSFVIPTINGVLIGMGSSQQIATKLDSANLFSMYMIYLLIGYFIREGYLNKIKKGLLIVIGCFSISIFCSLQIWVWSTQFEHKFGVNCRDIFLLIVSICFFELIRRTPVKAPIAKVSVKLSEISFGIYFVHNCIMEGLNAVMNRYAIGVTYLSKFLILEIVSFAGSVLIIQVLSKNKLIAKYLLGLRNPIYHRESHSS